MNFLTDLIGKFFGSKSDRDIKEIMPYVEKVKAEYAELKNLSNDALRAKSQMLQDKLKAAIEEEQAEIAKLKEALDSEDFALEEKENIYTQLDKLELEIDEKLKATLDEILPLAFAIVKDTARRFSENEGIEVTANDFDRELAAKRGSIIIDGDKAFWKSKWLAGGNEIGWDMVHYDVQLIGGVVLHQGKISEMSTGEGKTLVATLPVFLNALTHRGVHIVTVNDYLSKRDSEWMGPLYEFHGLSVDCIDKHEPNSEARRKAYGADITFGTNNEFGFDYLRDNMGNDPDDLVQRKHIYAIVDEVDSVLIDDARTPLIISGPVPKGDDQLFDEFKSKVLTLVNAQKALTTQMLADARKLIQSGDKDRDTGAFKLLQSYKGFPKNKPLIKFLSESGMKALLHKTEDIYLQENQKRMPEVTDELFFVIDEKNNSVDLTDKGFELLAKQAEDPHFFVMPDIGSSIADIEKQVLEPDEKLRIKEELLADFSIKSERIHTVTQLLKAYSLFEKDVEYVVMDNKVKIVDEQTGRILDGRRYSDGLHQAIESKESVKVEAASQTFATITLQNYFRMYKKLAGMTGTAETEAGEFWNIYKLDVVVIPTNRPISRKDDEDLIYKTKREKYNAVIDEITRLVNAGRPVLVGTTSVEISELLSRMLTLRKVSHNVLNAKQHQREAEIVAQAGQKGIVTIATNMAGRGTDIKLSAEVKAAGGLAILGTERHESRRVDRQLRGRAGRQGDPGSSVFFASLEDDLMRLFGSERIAKIMDRMGLKDGEVIQHSLISKSIEKAQKRVEENNFGIRKRLLEYDDVMNSQREVIYKRRHNALWGEKLETDIANLIYDTCDTMASTHHTAEGFEDFELDVIKTFSIESPVSEAEFVKIKTEDLIEKLHEAVLAGLQRRFDSMVEHSMPVIKDIYETQGNRYEHIVFPVTDGQRGFQILVHLKKAYESKGRELLKSYQKAIVLSSIDELWKEHLREMDELKQSVQNAAYEQKDPLLIYKFEAYELFRGMIERVNRHVVSFLSKGHVFLNNPEEVKKPQQRPKKQDLSKLHTQKDEFLSPIGHSDDEMLRQQMNAEGRSEQGVPEKVQPIRVEKKPNRNDQCPCGSGKKYKNCHGKDEL